MAAAIVPVRASSCACVRTQYKRADVGIMAFGVQAVTVVFLFMMLCVDLFVSLDESDPSLRLAFNVLGFDSITSFLVVMIVTARDTNLDADRLLPRASLSAVDGTRRLSASLSSFRLSSSHSTSLSPARAVLS